MKYPFKLMTAHYQPTAMFFCPRRYQLKWTSIHSNTTLCPKLTNSAISSTFHSCKS